MSSIFANLNTEGHEEVQDRLGGFKAKQTDTYTGVIKALYAGKSSGGAHSCTLILTLEDNSEYRETLWVTNKKGENWFEAKDKDGKLTGKKQSLPGFVIADDICLVAAGKTLSEMVDEEKIMNVYDSEAKREMPKAVPMLVEALGQKVTVAIVNALENVSEKDGNGNYVLTPKEREVNSIDKVFDPESKATVLEAKQAAANGTDLDPKFYAAWVERNRGKQQDKRKMKDGGQAGTSGRPNAGPPQAGANNGVARKSLFGGASAN